MGHRKEKHEKKIRLQLINKKENKEYYQAATEWHTDSTEQEVIKRRKL